MAKNKAVEDTSVEVNENEVVSSATDTKTVEAKAAVDYNKAAFRNKQLVNVYKSEKKVPVTISPFYAPYLGRVVRQSVNGVFVDIPADGQTYYVNETHADHIIAKIKRIDAMIARQKRAGDVSNNFELAPGELQI
jgi:hypothetical protein